MTISSIPIMILLLGPIGSGVSPDASPGFTDLPRFLTVLEGEAPRHVHLGTIDQSGAELLDVDAGWFDVPFRKCLAILRDDKWTARPSRMRVIARDGQVFPGSFMVGDRDSVTVRHPWMHEMRIPLEEIERVEFKPMKTTITDGDQDHVLLLNGDVLTGFIEQVDDPVKIEVTRDQVEMFEIPLDRIAEIRLAGESTPPEWPRAWFVDGLQVTVPSISVDETGRVVIGPHEFMTGRYERYPSIDEMVAIVMNGDRFKPLSAVDVKTIAIDPLRRVNADPKKIDVSRVLGLSDLHLSGPVQHKFALKEGFNQFRSTLDRPRNSEEWSPPSLEIRADETVIWSGEVDTGIPIDLELPDSCESLVITIECGEHGPIHCGVILRDPIISRQSTVGNQRQLLE